MLQRRVAAKVLQKTVTSHSGLQIVDALAAAQFGELLEDDVFPLAVDGGGLLVGALLLLLLGARLRVQDLQWQVGHQLAAERAAVQSDAHRVRDDDAQSVGRAAVVGRQRRRGQVHVRILRKQRTLSTCVVS